MGGTTATRRPSRRDRCSTHGIAQHNSNEALHSTEVLDTPKCPSVANDLIIVTSTLDDKGTRSPQPVPGPADYARTVIAPDAPLIERRLLGVARPLIRSLLPGCVDLSAGARPCAQAELVDDWRGAPRHATLPLVKTSLADWLQAWGTVAGAVFAAAAATAAFLVLLHEIKVRRRDEADLRASTARMVLVTLGQPEGKWPKATHSGEITSVELHVNNFSRFPVVDVAVSAERLDGGPLFAYGVWAYWARVRLRRGTGYFVLHSAGHTRSIHLAFCASR